MIKVPLALQPLCGGATSLSKEALHEILEHEFTRLEAPKSTLDLYYKFAKLEKHPLTPEEFVKLEAVDFYAWLLSSYASKK